MELPLGPQPTARSRRCTAARASSCSPTRCSSSSRDDNGHGRREPLTGHAGHHRRSRPARRPAERARRRLDRRQDRVRRSPERRRTAGHRGLGVRQPEMGAADGAMPPRSSPASPGARASATPRSCPISPASSARSRPASREIAIFAASSETFSRRNINQSIDESLATYAQVCARALASGTARPRLPVDRVRLSVRRRRAADRSSPTCRRRLLDMGVFEVAISDTIGVAHPGQVPLRARTGADARAGRTRRAALPRHARDGARQRPAALLDRRRARSTRRPAASAAARTRRARPAIWRPTI